MPGICDNFGPSYCANWNHSLHNQNKSFPVILRIFYISIQAFVRWTTFHTDSTFEKKESNFLGAIRMTQTAPRFQSSETQQNQSWSTSLL